MFGWSDMFLKVRHVKSMNNRGGVIFAIGMPNGMI
jgi:hypothetical protein